MGRIVTPTYAIYYTVWGTYITPAAWDTKHCGRPTNGNLAKYMQVFLDSFKMGGINGQAGPITVTYAKVVRQADNKTVAEWTAPTETA